MIIWFATGNTHKRKELAAILSAALPMAGKGGGESPAPEIKIPWELKIPADAGLSFDPEETGVSFLDNALIKAGELFRLLEEKRPPLYTSGDLIIADDSGLCVDALNGRPGIHSARYGGKELPAAEKNAKLLLELGDSPMRSARFICAMVLYFGSNRFFAVQETVEGNIVTGTGTGGGGFGYDPVFHIPEIRRTMAELSEEEKNRLSHRGKAGRAIAAILNK